MPLYLFVNGNRVHDGSLVDGAHPPLTFASKEEGEAYADAMYENTRRENESLGWPSPPRESYVIASEQPKPTEPKAPA